MLCFTLYMYFKLELSLTDQWLVQKKPPIFSCLFHLVIWHFVIYYKVDFNFYGNEFVLYKKIGV